MEFVVDRLAEACEAMPAEECSAARDPTALLRLLFHVDRGLQLCLLCLDSYHARDLPAEERRESSRLRADGWQDCSGDADEPDAPDPANRPWQSTSWRDWLAASERLMELLREHHAKLDHAYRTAKRPDAAYRPSESLALLWAHAQMCALARHPEREAILARAPRDFGPSVLEQELAVCGADEPVLHYSMSSLMDALYRLLSELHRLRFSLELVRYLWLLEMRAAQFLLYSGDSLSHDCAQYRRKVVGAGDGTAAAVLGEEFACNRRFLSDAATLLSALHERFVLAMQCERRDPTPRELEEDAPLREALRAWFRERARAMTTDVASEWFEKAYVAAMLRPREKEIFRRDYPTETCTDLTVLSKYRSKNGEYKRIMQETERPVKDIVLRDVDGARETLSLQFALHEMLALHFRTYCSALDWSAWSWTERAYALQPEALRIDGEPRLVQVFHYFQLYDGEHLVQFDSYLGSLARWFRLVARRRDGLLTRRIHLYPILRRMLGERELARLLPELRPPAYAEAPPGLKRPRRAAPSEPEPGQEEEEEPEDWLD